MRLKPGAEAMIAAYAKIIDAKVRIEAGDRGNAVRDMNEAVEEFRAATPKRRSLLEVARAETFLFESQVLRSRGENLAAFYRCLKALRHCWRAFILKIQWK